MNTLTETPSELILQPVCEALDRLIESAQSGLFPSLLDRQTGAMLDHLPPAIPGQRDNDRCHSGSNLIHDTTTLKTLYALAARLGRPHYAEAADAYLHRFATHCTRTETGLFPWGEHSYWDLVEDRVGNSFRLAETVRQEHALHDHLRQAPIWLWEKLWSFNPACVERFAEGLEYHWSKETEYIRHAPIEKKEHHPVGPRSCDFPRHGGFYLLDWAYAWRRTRREDFARQMRRMTDYWWPRRSEAGLLPIETRSPVSDTDFYGVDAPAQTLSLAVSLLEAAEWLEMDAPDWARTWREQAGSYLEGFLNAPHDLERGGFVMTCRREDREIVHRMAVWGSQYGKWPATYPALTCLCAHRLRPHPGLLRWAEAVGARVARTPFPADQAVPAMDAGLAVALLADLYEITGETRWREHGLRLAETLISLYLDSPLPRGAAGIDWYESQMGPGFLLHGLARIALLAEDSDNCMLTADYSAR